VEAPTETEKLHEWLRALKDQSGLSFAAIAQAIGEEERNVKRWIPDKAQPKVPLGDTMLRLLSALGVTLNPPPPETVRAVNAKVEELRWLLAETKDLIRTARAEAERERVSLGRRLKQLEATFERQGEDTTAILETLVADVEQLLARLNDEGGQASRSRK
jgi:transcriptional regulator with XRE-family HTH domain